MLRPFGRGLILSMLSTWLNATFVIYSILWKPNAASRTILMNIYALFLTPQIVASKPQFKNAFSGFPMLLIPVETLRCERIYPRKGREAHLIYKARTIEPLGSKAPCKRTQHCWPTTLNIVGCYTLRPFAHPVACCYVLLRKV